MNISLKGDTQQASAPPSPLVSPSKVSGCTQMSGMQSLWQPLCV